MYFLKQIRKQFFANICAYQTAPESINGKVEVTPKSEVNTKLSDLRQELEAIELSKTLDNEKVDAYKVLLVKMLDDTDIEDSEVDVKLREKVEGNIIIIQKKQIENSLEELQSEIQKAQSQYPEIAGEFLENVASLTTDMSPEAPNSDVISSQEADRDRITSEIERLRVAIIIHDNPENISVRHEVLEESFSEIDDNLKEGLLGNSIEYITAGDIYTLKKRGVDLATVFVSPPTRGETMSPGDTFVTNFGSSQVAHKLIGAGDILPIERVYSVKINGVEATRKFSPRPGYYSVASGKYMPIYDGYKIEIGEVKDVSADERKDLDKARNQRFMDARSVDVTSILRENKDNTVPFSHESDIGVVDVVLLGLKIAGLSFDREAQQIQFPKGMEAEDLGEALDNYSGVKSALRDYITQNESSIVHVDASTQQLSIPEIEGYSPFLVRQAFSSLIREKSLLDVSFESEAGLLTAENNTELKDMFGGNVEYTGTSTRHLKYMSEVTHAATETGVPQGAIIKLIYKENHGWDPTITARGSSAYGLGQMINGTWSTYGRGLDRNNPRDQLLATARYMKAIKTRKDCPWEHVLAYYNTGEGIQNVSSSQISKYAQLNWGSIASKIPGGMSNLNHQTYFTAAVAYYNSISYDEAKNTL